MKKLLAIGLATCLPIGLAAENPAAADPQFLGTVDVVVLDDSMPLAKDLPCASQAIAKAGRPECMAVHRAVAEKWKQVTGVPIIEGYGLTETAPVAISNALNIKDWTGTIGLPIPSTEAVLLDEQGREVPRGEVGEISIRGPQVTRGYWNQDDETAKAFTADGWFRTGDMGFMNEKGYFKITDRKKDMILVSGFNVYPNEVEDVIMMHPGVLEVAVVGTPDERAGEVVKAVVVKKDPALTAEALIAHCHKQLAGYKVPKIVEFRTEPLPKTNIGKVLRRMLRDNAPVNPGT